MREQTPRRSLFIAILIACSLAWSGGWSPARAQSGPAWSSLSQDIRLAADHSREWSEGSIHYVLLEGDVLVEQGLRRIRSSSAIAWWPEDNAVGPVRKIDLMASGNVRVDGMSRETVKKSYLAERLETQGRLVLPTEAEQGAPSVVNPLVERARAQRSALPVAAIPDIEKDTALTDPFGSASVSPAVATQAEHSTNEPPIDPGVVQADFRQAEGQTDSNIQQVQSTQPNVLGPGGSFGQGSQPIANENRPTPSIRNDEPPVAMPSLVPAAKGGPRRLRFFSRTSQRFAFSSSKSPDGQFTQMIFTGGVNLIVEEINTGNVIDVVADRLVVWVRGDVGMDPVSGEMQSDGRQEIEVYLEGNVYIRQGNPSKPADNMGIVLFGKQAYVNVNTQQAIVLEGAVEAFDPRMQIPLYMTANEIRQLAPGEYYGNKAAFTTSAHRGVPGFAIEGSEIYFEEIKQRIKNPFTRQDVIDTQTGQPMEVTRHFATAYNNVLRVNDWPVFYWPYVHANAEDPLGPVENVRLGASHNLGTIASASLDMWQLMGLDHLPIADSTNWLLDMGYFSSRGVSGGSRFNYLGQGGFVPTDSYWGNALGWYINDNGYDNLGLGRRGLKPSTNNRGRILLQNRYDYNDDLYFITELSYLSDSNVLESFFEPEYDAGKDQDTLIYGKWQRDNLAVTGLVQPRLRDFLPQNAWLPRGDLYLLGQSLLDDRLTYYTHSSAAYGYYNTPSNYVLPTDETFDLGRFDTRHEIDLPFAIGPWQVTPFVMGDFTGYTQAISANGLGRLYGAAGVRTSIPFYRVYPTVHSDLFYLNGLAHKVAFNVDYTYAYSNRDYTELPQMDQLDDDTSDLVRRQNVLRTFGGIIPQWYDPRFQALRRNIIYYPEALDNLNLFRVSLTQRLQTKRGPVNNLRIIDWMYLDGGLSIFPNANQNNLGKTFGLIDYNYRWNIGDRTSWTSNGLYEPAQSTFQFGTALTTQKPPRSTASLLYSHFDSGPFRSDYVGAGSSYRLSNRYASYCEIGKELDATNNSVNVRASFSRIGLDFVTTLGINWNAGRNDFGVDFSVLPRVGVRSTYGRSSMKSLPFGVEPTAEYVQPTMQRQAIITQGDNTY